MQTSQHPNLEDLLQELATQQPHLQDLTAKIENLCAHIPRTEQANDFQNLNNRVYNIVRKMLKQTEDGLEKRLNDLASRMEHKIKRHLKKAEDDALNIVQWFPEETSEDVQDQTLLNVENNFLNRVLKEQISIDEPILKDKIISESTDEYPVDRKKVKKRKEASKVSDFKNDPAVIRKKVKKRNLASSEHDIVEPLLEQENVKKRKLSSSESGDTNQKTAKLSKKCSKCSREKSKSVNNFKKPVKPKTFKASYKGENGTTQWLFERGKRRELTREKEQESEWQFDRARGRLEARKGDKDRAHWYFKRYDLHAPDKKGYWTSSDNFVFST